MVHRKQCLIVIFHRSFLFYSAHTKGTSDSVRHYGVINGLKVFSRVAATNSRRSTIQKVSSPQDWGT